VNLDYTIAQRAGRRSGGGAFTLQLGQATHTGSRKVRMHDQVNGSAKLTLGDVIAIRRWAMREGFGLTRRRQARVLNETYPHVTQKTLLGVLANETWRDQAYMPGSCDEAFWGQHTLQTAVFVCMSTVLATSDGKAQACRA